MQIVLTPQIVIAAYRQGLFPMAHSTSSRYIHWVCPEMRGQLPIQTLHIPRSLKRALTKTMRSENIHITVDHDFEGVIQSCAQETNDRPESWINADILRVFCQLHDKGHAHSLEVWEDKTLIGGIYGLKIGTAFFGESMFSRRTNASKIALAHLAARLWRGGFEIFDTQFINDHLKQFGAYELPHKIYMERLRPALDRSADFHLRELQQNDILEDYLAHLSAQS